MKLSSILAILATSALPSLSGDNEMLLQSNRNP
jgi:hypothetical protein